MKEYMRPEIEVYFLEEDDVIRTSLGENELPGVNEDVVDGDEWGI